jgi:hypothetical protein
MAKKKSAKKSESEYNQTFAAGVGLTAAAVAAAGAYFLYGSKEADKNRKTVKSWALKAKAEVLEQMEEAKKMSREEYEDMVHAVAGAYAGAKGATKKDIVEFASEMKDHWDVIEDMAASRKKAAKKTVKKATKAVKKTAKKAPKKTAKKAVKKTAKKTTKK